MAPTTKPTTDEQSAPPADVLQQASYSGTPRLPSGDTRPDEYLGQLRDPLLRMRKFEEMGSADDAIFCGIDARRKEISAANWVLSSEDTSTQGREILEFVEDNLYPHLDNLLRLVGGGAIQYGFGCVEPIFAWSDSPPLASITRGKIARASKGGSRRLYLAKLAHIRQRTVYTFGISVTGDLQRVTQHVFNGERYARIDIPGDRVLLWTYNKQGDDNWGVPPTRHAYKAFTFKTQLERLNLLSFERFGTGIPVAEGGEGWSNKEYETLTKYLKEWSEGELQFVVHPQGGKISILSATGQMAAAGLTWYQAYNLAIAKVYLTQQTELGATERGARSLGETFYEQMEGIVQADCEELANLINNVLIVPLVRWNYGPQDTYPIFAPSQRVRVGSGVAQVMQQLIAVGAIHPRPEDEMFFRDAFGLPSVDLKTLEQEDAVRAAKAPNANAPDPATPTDPASGDGKTPGTPAGNTGEGSSAFAGTVMNRRDRQVRQLDAAPPTIDGTAPQPAVAGVSTYRTSEYSAWEQRVLRPDVLARDLNLQATRLTGEVQDVLRQIDDNLASQVTSIAGAGTAALSAAVKKIAVPDRLRTRLRAVMLAAAMRAKDYGAQAVRNEVERQSGVGAVGPTRAPSVPSMYSRVARWMRALVAADDEQSAADLRVQAEVDGAVEDEIDRREQSARSAALTALATAAAAAASTLASVASTAIKAALLGLSTARTTQNVQGVVNTAFGVGRTEEADAIASGGGGAGGSGLTDANGNPIELVSKVYSAVMDGETCDECAKWDGGDFPIDYPEDMTGVQCPNPRCAGGYDQCRCLWIYVTSDESTPALPAAKGPMPIARAA